MGDKRNELRLVIDNEAPKPPAALTTLGEDFAQMMMAIAPDVAAAERVRAGIANLMFLVLLEQDGVVIDRTLQAELAVYDHFCGALGSDGAA